MKINRLDAHDRFKYFVNQDKHIKEFIEFLDNFPPFGNHPYYLFIIHKRTVGEDEKRAQVAIGMYDKVEDIPDAYMDMQARLGKPECAPNTSLIKLYPGREECRIIWSLPEWETWEQFEKDKMFHGSIFLKSIDSYKNNKKKLEDLEKDDPQSWEEFKQITKRSEGRCLIKRVPIFGIKF